MKYSGMKKILALALAAVLCMSTMSVGALASEETPAVSLMEELIPLPEATIPEEEPVADAAAEEPAPEAEADILPEAEVPAEDIPGEEVPEAKVRRRILINPHYAHILDPEDIILPGSAVLDGASASFSTLAALGAYLREQMVARVEEIRFSFTGDFDDVLDVALMQIAVMHTGIPKEGDSLRFQFGGAGLEAYGNSYTMTVRYYTTAAEETAVDNKVAEIKASLNLPRASSYETVKAVHDYLCETVTYTKNYQAAETAGNMKPWSTYGALVNKDCVCQGYSLAMYRLLLECGIDCRIIAGTGNGGGHAWNIVKLGDLYYSVDATWDDQDYGTIYNWFLRGTEVFYLDHTAGSESEPEYYQSSVFWTDYKMSKTDYNPQNSGGGDEEDNEYGIAITAATFPDTNFRTYVAKNLDPDMNGWLSATEIEAVTEINVSGLGIWDMTGVGFFTELRVLDCYDNYIKELDVSGFLGLEYLDVGANNLESLTLGRQDYLYALYCDNNSLEELDVTGCPELWFMWCHNNALEELDLTGCPQLVELSCYDNYIEYLDVSLCPVLGALVETITPVYDYDYGVVDYYYEASENLYYELLTDIGVMIYTRELLGDVNGDGYINAADAMLVLMHAVGTGTLTGDAAYQADVNCDEVIDARDAAQILRYGNGLSTVIGRTAPG